LSTVDTGVGGFLSSSDDAVADGPLISDDVGALAILRNDFQDYSYFYAVNDPNSGRSVLFKADANGTTTLDPNDPTIGPKGPIFEPGLNRIQGFTTGMAFLNDVLYGVSDDGQFFTINPATGIASVKKSLTFNGQPIHFAGLTNGPQHAVDLTDVTVYADLLFAIDTSGRLFALNTTGDLQAVFRDTNPQVTTLVTSAVTSFSNATGLAFAPNDINLWHPTVRQGTVDGHGVPVAPDNSREYNPFSSIQGHSTNQQSGGVSFYFGLEEYQNSLPDYLTYGQNAQFGFTAQEHRDLASNPGIGNNYNLPGGAKGALETNSFSLAGYSYGDKPTLYFNYFLETEDAAGPFSSDTMRDSARVYVTTDDGMTWTLVATNNTTKSVADGSAELPAKSYESSHATTRSNQVVQELFDNTGDWRQARIDLGDFAGKPNVQLRFEFSTSAVFDILGKNRTTLSGNASGNAAEGGQDNNHEGFYIDDIIVGFAERGEMVTNAPTSNPTDNVFVQPDQDEPAFLGAVYPAGQYQLEIRRGTEMAVQYDLNNKNIGLVTILDTNDRQITTQGRLGDQNLIRQQGALQILNSVFSHNLNNGILAQSGARVDENNDPQLAHQGFVRNLPVLNTEQLVPGVLIANNVFYDNGDAALDIQGEPTSDIGPGAVPFVKIVNNTIYGADTAAGIGIKVSNNAAPTILNNIIANTATGIDVDDSSKEVEIFKEDGSSEIRVRTIIGTTIFQGIPDSDNNNVKNATASNSFTVGDTDPLFVNAAARNFYLVANSRAIDSSINTLQDRPSQVAVKGSVGLPPAPILAPERDLFGVIRIDDPFVPPPPGLGSNIFKDRGAIERTDSAGPTVILTNPLDNGAEDLNSAGTIVVTHNPTLTQLVLRFADTGVGLDDLTIVTANFTLTRNGTTLVDGTDYTFAFNPATNEVSFTFIDTIEDDYVYELTLDNTSIQDIAGNRLQPNRGDGSTAFTIVALNGVNDPPVNSVPGTQSVPEDTLLKFSTANGNAISISDPDAAYGNNQAQVTLSVINGIMTIGTKAGLTFIAGDGTSDKTMTFRGTIPAINNALQGLLYRGNPNYAGSDTLTITTSDLGNFTLPFGPVGTDTDTVAINVTPVNDAPILDNSGTMTLTSIKENQFNTAGNLITEIILSAGGNRITDVDAGALEGIAIHGVNNSYGQWQFSLNNGTTWSNITGVNSGHALLLASNTQTRVRFVPNEGFSGLTGFTFAAWDQSSGSNGSFASLSSRGGSTPFSLKNESAFLTVTPIPHAITITNLGGQVNFVEKDPPVFVSTTAVVTDSQAPIFGGGRFTATLTANATADDRLAVNNQGNAAGQIGVSGANVSYGGTLFGTISGGVGTAPLVVNFNANATQAAVQALVRNLTFSVLGPTPSTTTRAIKLELRDVSDDTSFPVYKNLGVITVNDPPTIQADTSTEANYVVGLAPVNILPSAVVTDIDSPTFPGGSLTVSSPFGAANDLLSIQNVGSGVGQISVFGSDVFYAGSKIGTYSGGAGSNPLVVNFTANATGAAAQQLIRSIIFSTVNNVVPNGSRSVTFTLNDGSGGSTSVTRSVRVFGGTLPAAPPESQLQASTQPSRVPTSRIDEVFTLLSADFLS
ncbi:MAG: hypothetical protein KDA68_09055, partial [Planctomycetaceae bacterium]|nr:hypothetical protein [Planctomycetaceae bacterium]